MVADYKCVTSVEGIKEYIGAATLVAFDYETSPDEAYRKEAWAALDPAKAHIVGCSFSVKEGTGIYVPIKHMVGQNIDEAKFYDFLRQFLTDTRIIKIAHNIAFESSMSYHRGIVIQPPVYDTIAASQMSLKSHTEFRKLWDSGLKKLAPELCGEELPSFSSVTDGKHFDELDAQDYETVRYGSADSDFAFRLYHKFNNWFDRFMPKHRMIVEEIESPTAAYLGIMKHNGIPVNKELMLARKEEADKAREDIKDKIAFMIGDVNIGENASTAAFKNYLFKTLKLPVLKMTAKEQPALDDSALILLKEWCDKNKPELSELFTLIQEYRKWGKITSTYIDGYLEFINNATGKIHPEIFALSTETGRMSSRKPNAQNMPRKTNDPVGIRNFIAAPEGHSILSLDFSQIELRVGAFYCRDEVMMDTYKRGGDIHAATTSVIFGCSYEEAQDKHREGYKEQRTIAKNVNFGTFYGLFPKGLQQTLRFKAGKIDMVIVKSISRFARNTQDCLMYSRKLKNLGIGIIFEKENINTLDATGELLFTILSSLAQDESRNISENCKWGIRSNFQKGIPHLNTFKFMGFDKNEEGRLIINKEEAKLVKRVFREFLEGSSPEDIARHFNEEGIPGVSGEPKWRRVTILGMLEQEKYMGDCIMQKWYTSDYLTHSLRKNTGQVDQYYVKDSHEAIIDRKTWTAVQQELERRKEYCDRYHLTKYSYRTEKNPFYGRIVCTKCGHTYGRKSWSTRDIAYWKCKTDGCGENVKEADLNKVFMMAWNNTVKNREKYLERWCSKEGNELAKIRGKQMVELTAEGTIDKAIPELIQMVLEKIEVNDVGHYTVCFLDGTSKEILL